MDGYIDVLYYCIFFVKTQYNFLLYIYIMIDLSSKYLLSIALIRNAHILHYKKKSNFE